MAKGKQAEQLLTFGDALGVAQPFLGGGQLTEAMRGARLQSMTATTQ